MLRNDPWQFIAQGTYQYQLAVRTFIPSASLMSFKGDNRSFSTSEFATYRSGMFVVFDVGAGRITERLVGYSTGTRRSASEPKLFATVQTRLRSVDGAKGRVAIRAHMDAHDPYPFVEKVAPNIDTDINFRAFLNNGNLFIAGNVVGDTFPSTEVFIRDSQRQALLLLQFATPHHLSGVVRLIGAGTRPLGSFRTGIKLDSRGRFIRVMPWFQEEAQEHEHLSLIRETGHEDPAIPSDVLFDFDSARLKSDAEKYLHKWATVLNSRTGVVIEGHTDSVGKPEYNIVLSLRRAIAVRDWFIKVVLHRFEYSPWGLRKRARSRADRIG